MTFNLNYFLPAVALLWLPLPCLAGRNSAFSNRARVTSATMGGAFRAWQNWADLIRAAVGVYGLMAVSIALEPGSANASQARYVEMGILLVGVLLQVVRFGQGILAPLFYLTGMTAVLPHPIEGGFAILLAWVFGCGTRDPRFILPIMAAALLVASYFLGRLDLLVLFNIGLILLPLAMGVLLQKRLMYVTREPRVSTYQRRRYRILHPPERPAEAQVTLKPGKLNSRTSTAK